MCSYSLQCIEARHLYLPFIGAEKHLWIVFSFKHAVSAFFGTTKYYDGTVFVPFWKCYWKMKPMDRSIYVSVRILKIVLFPLIFPSFILKLSFFFYISHNCTCINVIYIIYIMMIIFWHAIPCIFVNLSLFWINDLCKSCK